MAKQLDSMRGEKLVQLRGSRLEHQTASMMAVLMVTMMATCSVYQREKNWDNLLAWSLERQMGTN